jgi:ABC-type transporter Mla subunit MlaD
MAFNTTQGVKLAQLIRDWLTSSRQGEPQGELLNFISDIQSANNVGVWAGVDYERILPFKAPLPKAIRYLAILRNSLIFLPIVITWVALEQAASSWSSAGSDGGNFLQHWQGLESVFSLRYVAWFDAAIIGFLIVLTVITGFLEESNKGRTALELQYQGLMIALERELSGYRYLSLQDINTVANDTLNSLRSATGLMETASDALAESSVQAHDAIVGANDVVHNTFAPTVQRLDAVISGLSNAAAVHGQMADLVKTVQSDFATQMATLRQGVIDVLAAVDTRSSQILQNIDGQVMAAANTLTSSSHAAMADINRTAQTVGTGLTQQVGQQLQGLTDGLDQALRGLSALTDSLGKTIADLNSTSNNVMVNTATLADDLNQIHGQLQQVLRNSLK